MVHKEGELASAKAAAELNQLYVLSAASTYSIEQVVEATKGNGNMLLELDVRLPKLVVLDLVLRASQHKCFKGVVLNCQYLTSRVSENEWKNDFVIPPHLKAGSLLKYCWSEP